MQIYPFDEWYYTNDIIGCSADANPPALIEWENLLTGEKFEGEYLTITGDMAGELLHFQCIATNEVKGTPRNHTKAIEFEVIGEYYDQKGDLR